jgi:hypothetical protein
MKISEFKQINCNSMKKIWILLTSIAILNSCTQSKKNEVEVLESEVMKIHDEVMPNMGEIMGLKNKLEEKLVALDSTKAGYQGVKQEIDSIAYLLTNADNDMMDWMDEYSADSVKAMQPADAALYLANEKKKINTVKESTLKSIEAAKAYLNKK